MAASRDAFTSLEAVIIISASEMAALQLGHQIRDNRNEHTATGSISPMQCGNSFQWRKPPPKLSETRNSVSEDICICILVMTVGDSQRGGITPQKSHAPKQLEDGVPRIVKNVKKTRSLAR